MAARFAFALAATMLLAGSAAAQTQVIVQDNFDQYANTDAFLQAWGPSNGLGTVALPPSDPNYYAGVLNDDPFVVTPIPGVQGKAIDHIGSMVNQWGGAFNPDAGGTPAFSIVPSATQSVFLSADIFVGSSGNERMSVGLRATLPDGPDADTLPDTQNIIELGSWNANPTVLGVPGTAQVSAHFAVRAQLFGVVNGAVNPDWQYFELPIELDRETDLDEIVNVSDIGAAWHTYSATITPNSITFTIDLYRDGKRNTSTVIDPETNERPGIVGEYDGVIVIENIITTANGFNNLRLGGASGLVSAGPGLYGFDNVLLQLQPADAGPGGDGADFNGDGIVDGADFLVWQRGESPNPLSTGDLDLWKAQFGGPPSAAPAIGAVPEPATFALAGMALVAGLAAVRRR